MKYLFIFITWASAFAENSFQSPIRNICQKPSGPALSEIRTVEDLRSSCSMLSQNSSTDVAELSRSVLSIVEAMAVAPGDSILQHRELLNQVGKLTDAVSSATISQAESPREQLGADIRALARDFPTTSSRRERPGDYYTSIKNIIAQTSQGRRVIDCFENSADKRVVSHRLKFIGEGDRLPGNDGSAYLDYVPIPKDPLGRIDLELNIDVRTHPLAAISMVAHEMQHSCLASTICNHINKCSDTDESECPQYNQAIFVDELTAHNFEAQIFAELAKSTPGIMCSYTYVDGVNGPQRLADLHAVNEESYQNGSLLGLLNTRYVAAGLWNPNDVYDPIAVQPGPRPSIRERLNSLSIPPQQ